MKKIREKLGKRLMFIGGAIIALIGVFALGAFDLGLESLYGGGATMVFAGMVAWLKDGNFKELSSEELEKLTPEETGNYLNAQRKHFQDSINEKLDNLETNSLKQEDIDKIKADVNKALDKMDLESLAKYNETIQGLKDELKTTKEAADEIRDIVKNQGNLITQMKENNIPDVRRKTSRLQQLKTLIAKGLMSKEYHEFEGRGFKGSSNKMFLDQTDKGEVELKDIATKATVDTSSHTGNVMISEISDIVRDDTPTRRNHVRDLMNVGMTDQAQIVAGQVYDFTDALTLGAVMLAENGEAPESVFKSKENTWGVKRIANSMRISKRELRVNGLKWVIDKVLAKLPDATLFVEDFQLLFGDGSGNNVQGISGEAQSFNLTPNAYDAGDISSVATYNSGTQALITFAAAHNIKNGDDLTIADATEGTYNATHTSVEVVDATQVIIDLTYVAEADTSAWTGSSKSAFYQKVDGAQEYDVLAVSDALLEAGEYMATGHIIHPSQATLMGLLKDTTENYLNISKDENGKVVGINGLPVITTTAMPAGKFVTGDFSRNGLELKEFTPLNIQFAEDVESKKKNEIVVIIEEEIIFPIYNPYWFIYGKFSTAKTQLETP